MICLPVPDLKKQCADCFQLIIVCLIQDLFILMPLGISNDLSATHMSFFVQSYWDNNEFQIILPLDMDYLDRMSTIRLAKAILFLILCLRFLTSLKYFSCDVPIY